VNSLERVLRRLKGESVDRPPNFDIFMAYAAHHIGQPLRKYYLDYRVLVDANLAMIDSFGVDIVQAISDPYRETHDFGADVEFPEDGLPICRRPLLEDSRGLRSLKKPDPTSGPRMLDRLCALRLMREKVRNETPVMGWVEGALAEAADLRGPGAILLDLFEQPEWLTELLEICVEVEIAFARAQVEAGADIVGLGDAIASQVSREIYCEFALPYERRIFEAVHAMGALTRLHICGNTTHLLPDMTNSGADIVDLDWMVDWKSACAEYGMQMALCGNVDPVAVMLQSGQEVVHDRIIDCLRPGGDRCISAAGCEIPDGTPEENLQAQRRALVEWGRGG
jgi:MtaA/CmuA family methyltransferase